MSASPPARSQQPASCPCPGFTPHAVPAPSAWVWTRGAPGLSRVLTQVLVARGTVAVSGACEEMAWSLPGDGSGRPSCHHVEKGLGAAPAAARGSGCSCEKGAALMTLGHPCQQAASLRAWDEGPPPRVFPGVCPGRGGGLVRLCSAPGLSLWLWPWESWLCSAPLSSGQLGQQAATRVLTRAHSAERSPGPLWPGEALWRAGRPGCAHVACFSERPQSCAHPTKPVEAGRAPLSAPPVAARARLSAR